MASGTMSDDLVPDEMIPDHLKAPDSDLVPDDALPNHLRPAPVATHTYNPTEGMSNLDLAMAGAGKAQVDAWRGLKQVYGHVADWFGGNRSKDTQQEIDDAAKRDAALMATGAGKVGYMGGAIADTAVPGAVAGEALQAANLPRVAMAANGLVNPRTVLGAAASGATLGALAPVQTGGSRLWNSASGAAMGMAGNVVSRVPHLFSSPEEAATQAVSALTDAGVPLDAAQRTGSVLLLRAKAMLEDNPFTAGVQKDFQELQAKSFTRAALKTIGETADRASPEVMGNAMERIGSYYDDVASRTNVPYDAVELPLANIETEARKVLNDSQFSTIRRNLDDILEKASQNGGVLNGAQFSNVKKTLDKLSRGSDTEVGEAARDIRTALQDALTSVAAPDDAALLRKANQQWGNMRKIEGAIDRDSGHLISPAKLANALGTKANRYNSVYGRGDMSLVNLAQAGKTLLSGKVPNSGTPARLIAGMIPAATVGGIEAIRSGDIKKGAAVGMGAYLVPKLIQKGMNSQGAGGGLLDFLGQAAGGEVPSSVLGGAALQSVPRVGVQSLLDRDEPTAEPEKQ